MPLRHGFLMQSSATSPYRELPERRARGDLERPEKVKIFLYIFTRRLQCQFING